MFYGLQDAQPRVNGTAASSRSQSTDGSRSRGTKSNGPSRAEKKFTPKQRVPNADEFPVLGGSTNSSRSSVNGSCGPTAAQVLQAPAPARKETVKDPVTRAASPEQNSVKNQAVSFIGSSLVYWTDWFVGIEACWGQWRTT